MTIISNGAPTFYCNIIPCLEVGTKLANQRTDDNSLQHQLRCPSSRTFDKFWFTITCRWTSLPSLFGNFGLSTSFSITRESQMMQNPLTIGERWHISFIFGLNWLSFLIFNMGPMCSSSNCSFVEAANSKISSVCIVAHLTFEEPGLLSNIQQWSDLASQGRRYKESALP